MPAEKNRAAGGLASGLPGAGVAGTLGLVLLAALPLPAALPGSVLDSPLLKSPELLAEAQILQPYNGNDDFFI